MTFFNLYITKTVKDFIVVTFGRSLASGLGFLATVLLARELDPANFGMFSLALYTMIVLSGIAGGSIDQAIVKFSAPFVQKDPKKAYEIFKTTLFIKTIICFVLLCLSFLVTKQLSKLIFEGSVRHEVLQFSFIGSISVILFGYVLAYLQSHQYFYKHVSLEIINNLFKLLSILSLIVLHYLNVFTSLLIYVVMPLLSLVFCFRIIPKILFYNVKINTKVLIEILQFSKWIVLSYIFFSLQRRMDVFILGHYENLYSVGQYSAALTITATLDLISLSIFVVVYPKVSTFTSNIEYLTFFKKFLLIMIPLYFFICIILWLLSDFIISLLYTAEYSGSVIIFRILVPGYAVYIFALPLSSILLALNKPQVIAGIDFIALLAMFLGSTILIPYQGTIGAALASLISNGVFVIIMTQTVYHEVKRLH
jgi:O-antigen/teichoic acid export membrane protein